MFKLHIYNPEHDIALGKNCDFFTPPKAARLTRNAFCHRPALWADDGDWVLVDDVEIAERNLSQETSSYAKVRFVTWNDLRRLREHDLPSRIEPWGWDRFLVSQLLRCNKLFASLVPSEEQLHLIRQLSSRRFVADVLLPQILLTDDCLEGKMRVCENIDEIMAEQSKYSGSIVVKSPWSCSGRGVRFFSDSLTVNDCGWIRNILAEQGCVLVEPLYDKVIDFAMEFHADEDCVVFHGLNVFTTRNGAYLGNIEGTQEEKWMMISEYVSIDTLSCLKENIIRITRELFKDRYQGPFGIDMMIVRTSGNETKVHPCVEMNLRRTMGQ